MNKVGVFFKKNIASLTPPILEEKKKSRILLTISIVLIALSIFFSVLSQLPFFTYRNLTHPFQIGWIISLIPLVMVDYKRILKLTVFLCFLLLPFILYLLIAYLFHIYSLSYAGTRLIFTSSYLFLIGMFFGKYKTSSSLHLFLFSFLFASIIYAGNVYITKLQGYDISNQIYAFGDKNSAGPIFMAAAIAGYYLFSKRNWIHISLKWLIILYFVIIIALSKNRAVLVLLPLLIGIIIYRELNNKIVFFSLLTIFSMCVVAICVIPSLYRTIVINILFNGKTNIDDIFSGRISQIITAFQRIKPVLGNGNYYIDCMPISFLNTYGIIGILSLIPIAFFPFYIITKVHKSASNNNRFSVMLSLLGLLFGLGSIFEGYGFFGPGAKVFIFWLTIGIGVYDFEFEKKAKYYDTGLIIGIKTQNLLKKSQFTFVLQFISLLGSVLLISVSNLSYSISGIVIDTLPQTFKTIKYNEVEEANIEMPIKTMCVGQTILFKAVPSPLNADLGYVRWGSGNYLEKAKAYVDGYSGNVTAIETGGAFITMYYYKFASNHAEKFIRFNIVDYDAYDFNSLYISTRKYEYSFQNINNEIIDIGCGDTSNLYYDTFYLPCIDDFEFVSSNPDIATIDSKTGVIRGISKGTCSIKGIIKNKFNNESVNTITINVQESSFIPVTSFDIQDFCDIHQYTQYNISPIFNNDATDKKIFIEVDRNDYTFKDNIISFSESGEHHIIIGSQSNPSFYKEYTINIKENKPIRFECDNKWIKVGEKKNSKQLGIYLVYEDGYRKIVTDDDLLFDPNSFSNRAWTGRNGLLDNRTTILAIKKGIIQIKVTSKLDNNIKATFNITSSVYSEKEYKSICQKISYAFIDIISLFAIFFNLCISTNHNWLDYLLLLLTPSIIILLIIVCLGFSISTLVLSSFLLLATIICFFVRYKKRNILPLDFLCDPTDDIVPRQ